MPDAIDALFDQDPPTLEAVAVAERLGVTKQTVYTWLRNGVIPGYRLGTTWIILRDELKSTLRANANHPGSRRLVELGSEQGDEA